MIQLRKEKLLEYLILFGITLTALALLGSPLIITAFFKSAFQILDDPVVTAVIISLYLCAIPYMWALINLHALAKMVADNTPFTMRSVQALKAISLSIFSEIFIVFGVIYYLKHSFEFFRHTLVIAPLSIFTFLCIVVSLLCYLLSQLFDRARQLKEDNDLTI